MSALPNNLIDIRQHVAQSGTDLSLESIVTNVKTQWPLLNNAQVVDIVRSMDSLVGILDPLSALLSNSAVTDIVINGAAEIWFDDGHGLHRHESIWNTEADVRRFAQALVEICERRLDVLNPFVDLQLPNGMRTHIVIPPISPMGTHMSFRIPRSENVGLHSLLAHQDEQVIKRLEHIVQSRKSFIVCGATGSGKTTLLRSLLHQVDAAERIVVIEDVQELNVQHDHVVSLQGRLPNSEHAGEVTMRQLVRQSLRMRPDRIVVGEIRGVEITDLFSALNTGHQGSAATVHANSASHVVSRLHMLGLLAGMTTDAIHSQIASALEVVIEVKRVGELRVVSEIGMLHYGDDGRTHYRPLLTCWPHVITHEPQALPVAA